jgi:hypothetical protein
MAENGTGLMIRRSFQIGKQKEKNLALFLAAAAQFPFLHFFPLTPLLVTLTGKTRGEG